MKDTIFVPVLILEDPFSDCTQDLIDEIKECKKPSDIIIIDAYFKPAYFTKCFWDRVIACNKVEGDESLFDEMIFNPVRLLILELECPHPLRYRKLEWLDECIKDFIRNNIEMVGIYFMYLTGDNDLTFHITSILNYRKNGQTMIMEDTDDDFSEFQNNVEFFNHLWYIHPTPSIEEVFPEIVAKSFLVFG
jgi:hypothetical protein